MFKSKKSKALIRFMRFFLYFVWLLIFVEAICLFSFMAKTTRYTNLQHSKSVNIEQLLSEYKANSYAAHLKYKDEYLRFNATVNYVFFRKTSQVEEVVEINAIPWTAKNLRVVASIKESNFAKAGSLKVASNITLVCRENGLLLDTLQFKECEIL